MNLCKLTGDNVIELLNKKIYCYEYCPGYMKDLAERFEIDNIEAVIDENSRNWGRHTIRESRIIVYGHDYLSMIDLDTAVFLIISD